MQIKEVRNTTSTHRIMLMETIKGDFVANETKLYRSSVTIADGRAYGGGNIRVVSWNPDETFTGFSEATPVSKTVSYDNLEAFKTSTARAEDGRIYAGAVIGVVYDKGEWFRVGADGGEYDGSIDFSSMYPWSDMEAVSVDGNAVVKVPKFYIKTDVLPDSSQHPGKRAFLVSGDMGPGYRLHPAFVENGRAKECIYIGAYEASLNDEGKAVSAYGKAAVLENSLQDTYDACPDGWHLQTVYERSAVNLLALIEIGARVIASEATAEAAPALTGSTSDAWRGLHEMWGNSVERIDGVRTDKHGYFRLFNQDGSGEYVTTDVLVKQKLDVNNLASQVGDGYNFADLFFPEIAEGRLDLIYSSEVCCPCDCGEGKAIGFRIAKIGGDSE